MKREGGTGKEAEAVNRGRASRGRKKENEGKGDGLEGRELCVTGEGGGMIWL